MYYVLGYVNWFDFEMMYDLVKFQILILMYGEYCYLCEYVKLGEVKGIVFVVVVNGMMLDLLGNVLMVIEYVEIGWIYLDGFIQVGVFDGIVCDCIWMVLNGYLIVILLMDENDELLGDLWCEVMGFVEQGWLYVLLVEIIEVELVQYLMWVKDKVLINDEVFEKELIKLIK